MTTVTSQDRQSCAAAQRYGDANAVRVAGVLAFTAGVEATDRLTPLTDEWLTPVAIAGATAVAVLAATYRPSRPVRVHTLREAST